MNEELIDQANQDIEISLSEVAQSKPFARHNPFLESVPDVFIKGSDQSELRQREQSVSSGGSRVQAVINRRNNTIGAVVELPAVAKSKFILRKWCTDHGHTSKSPRVVSIRR
jgi:hypothetical protein